MKAGGCPFARWTMAAVLALGVHALLAFLFAALFKFASHPQVLPELDLSSVELSLSKEDVQDAPLSPLPEVSSPPPAAEPEPVLRPPEAVELPPPPEIPPELAASTPPEPPPEERPKLDLPLKAEAPVSAEWQEEPSPLAPAPDQAKIEAPELKTAFDMKRIYPRESRLRGEEGDVQLEFKISAKGSVVAVSIVRSSGYPALDAAALKSARKAVFTPAREGNSAREATARLTLSFRLR